eukprot:c8111_g2_i2.p1 GENE.c8111_g2_i2~~c8111_g2_i2.p1  ORF type:complete len:116 (-),score=22.19 c8111_g2_i2:4-351(-)
MFIQMVIIRVPIFHLDLLNPDLVTLAFNWAGCMIVTISTVFPCQWVFHFAASPNRLVRVGAEDRVRFCLGTVLCYAMLKQGTKQNFRCFWKFEKLQFLFKNYFLNICCANEKGKR